MLRKLWIAVFVVSLMGLACTAVQPTSQGPATDGKPKLGGIFNVPEADDPTDFDMSYTGSTGTNGSFVRFGYSSLLRLKTGPDIGYPEVIVEPSLAERWEISPDATTFTFHLRKGLKYANVAPVNGRELTSADIKFSYEYMSRTVALKDKKLPAGQFEWMFEGLESIQTPDAFTVVVKFKEAFTPFLTYAASSDNVIMAHEIYDQDGHFKDRIGGSGPFQADFAASQKGSRWVFKKNSTYFEQGKPYLDEIHILVIKDAATRQAGFIAKQVDFYAAGGDGQVWEEIRRTVPNATEYVYTSVPNNLYVNLKRPPVNNFKVREAISLAYDRDALIKLGGGQGEWALAFSNLRTDLFTQEEIKSFIKYDPERARRLLAEAGYPNGLTVGMNFNADGTAEYKAQAELIQSQLKKVGINLLLESMPAADFNGRRRAKDFDIMLVGESSRVDLDGFYQLYVHPKGSFNYMSIDDPRLNTLVAAQRRETNPDKRNDLHRQLLRYTNESFTAITTFRKNNKIFMQPYLKDFYHNADLRTVGAVWNTWLDK